MKQKSPEVIQRWNSGQVNETLAGRVTAVCRGRFKSFTGTVAQRLANGSFHPLDGEHKWAVQYHEIPRHARLLFSNQMRRTAWRKVERRAKRGLHPAELSQTETIIPDFRQVANLVVFEIHRINIIGGDRFSGGGSGSAGAGVRSMKHGNSSDAFSVSVRGKELDFVTPVWDRREHRLHPIRVGFDRRQFGENVRLCGKRRIGVAKRRTAFPTPPGFAGFKKFKCDLTDIAHRKCSFSLGWVLEARLV